MIRNWLSPSPLLYGARKPSGVIRLVIGLGNPDREHQNTYHNAGAMFVDYLSSSLGGGSFKPTRNFDYSKIGKLALVKPRTYMNESGAAVSAAMKYFSAKGGSAAGGKVAHKNILIAHDDSDLAVGKFKLSVGQRPAGHHGIESIVSALGTNDFARLRIGVRPTKETVRKKAGDFVLKKVSLSDLRLLETTFEKAAEELQKLF